MIRINLLPYREIKKKETRSRLIFFLAAGMILYLLVLGGIQLYVWGGNRSLEADLKAKEEKLASLEKMVGEVDRIKKEKLILEKKVNVIDQLEKNRTYPVRMLAAIASQVPTKDAWLDRLTQSGSSLAIEGKARDNFAVVRFMRNLEGSPYIQSVELVSSKQVEVSGLKLQHFNLSCVLRSGV